MTRLAPVLTAHAAQQGDTPITGATLRELVAGLALAGLLARTDVESGPALHRVALDAVDAADALIAALADDQEDA